MFYSLICHPERSAVESNGMFAGGESRSKSGSRRTKTAKVRYASTTRASRRSGMSQLSATVA